REDPSEDSPQPGIWSLSWERWRPRRPFLLPFLNGTEKKKRPARTPALPGLPTRNVFPAPRTYRVGGIESPLRKEATLPLDLVSAFVPNRVISRTTARILIAGQVAVALLIWINSPFPVLPQPGEVAKAFRVLWFEQGLGQELWTSFTMNLQALALTVVIS